MNIEKMNGLISDEDSCWGRMEELRVIDIPKLLGMVAPITKEDAANRAVRAIHNILSALDLREHLLTIDPGHGIGHLTRDYGHALRLRDLDVAPAELFIGMIAGVLHDIGCAVVNRYDDAHRAVRHAEVGAILLAEVFKQESFGLNKAEQLLIQYGVAAHTRYLKPTEVTQSNGVKRTVLPYTDTDSHGDRLMAVWLSRWIDRLDCNGPCFVARHYLTLAEDHHDFSNGSFHEVTFASALRPLLRTREEVTSTGGKPTMLEHLQMFVNSQTNASPYGRHDFGDMVVLRDQNREQLMAIIRAVSSVALSGVAPSCSRRIQSCWQDFLSHNIEQTEVGLQVADALDRRFSSLPALTQTAWSAGFYATMCEYGLWAGRTLNALGAMPSEWMKLPSIVSDVRDFITPHSSWASSIH